MKEMIKAQMGTAPKGNEALVDRVYMPLLTATAAAGMVSAVILVFKKSGMLPAMALFGLFLVLILKVIPSKGFVPVPPLLTAKPGMKPYDSNKYTPTYPTPDRHVLVERNVHDKNAAFYAGYQFDRPARRGHPTFINSTAEPVLPMTHF